MKESYFTKAFRKTARERLPEREAVLNSAFEKRSSELRSEHARAGKKRLRHLESQILPAIAIYETFRLSCRKMKRLILFTAMWKSAHIGWRRSFCV